MSLITNSTAQSLLTDNGNNSGSEISGSTMFWAILTLALNAMGQDSPTTRWFLYVEKPQEGLLTLLLSSPIICLLDICVDLYLIILAVWSRTQDGYESNPPQSDHVPSKLEPLVAVRIMLIVFGVIPQAVRLYGMSGIPLTQTLATIYLAASLLRLLRNRLQLREQKQETESWSETQEGTESTISSFTLVTTIGRLVLVPILALLHFLAYGWLLDGASESLHFDNKGLATQGIYDIWTLFSLVFRALIILNTLLWTSSMLFDILRPLQRLPVYASMMIVPALSVVDFFSEGTREIPLQSRLNFIDRANGSLSASFTAFILASTSGILLKFLFHAFNGNFRSLNGDHAVSEDSIGALDAPEPVRDDIESLSSSTGVSRLKPTVTISTTETRHEKRKDPLDEISLNLHVAMSLMLGENVISGKDLSKTVTGLSDPIRYCRLISYTWRTSMKLLPRAVISVISGRKISAGPSSTALESISPLQNGETSDESSMDTRVGPGRETRLYQIFRDTWVLAYCLASLSFLQFGALFLASIDCRRVPRSLTKFAEVYLVQNWMLIFALLNLIVAGFHYIWLWDGTGTCVPGWESWLG